MIRRDFLQLVMPLAVPACIAGCASAVPAVTGPVRLVIPFPAGGSTDAIARVIAGPLAELLGSAVHVDPRPGQDGILAAEEVRHAAPDGRTLLFATATGFSGAPVLRQAMPFDPVADFTPISRLGRFVFVLGVAEHVPARSWAELQAYAQRQPAGVRHGAATATARLLAAQLHRSTGLPLTFTNYAGDAPMIAEALAGRVDIAMASAGGLLPHLRSGRLRALAVLLPHRTRLLPEVPTAAELGLDLPLVPWGGLFGPRGMAAGPTAAISAAVANLLARPDVREKLSGLVFEAQASTPQELGAFIADQLHVWRETARAAGVVPS